MIRNREGAAIYIDVPDDATEWTLIHIVNTRFMQEQPLLETLGEARLRLQLFEIFCFPTPLLDMFCSFSIPLYRGTNRVVLFCLVLSVDPVK